MKFRIIKYSIILIIFILTFVYVILYHHSTVFDFCYKLFYGLRFFFRGYRSFVFNLEAHLMLFAFFFPFFFIWRFTLYFLILKKPWWIKCFCCLYHYFFFAGIYFLYESYKLIFVLNQCTP